MSANALFQRFIQAADVTIREHAEEVAALDQAIGDGDHVTNLQRGLEALHRSAAAWEPMDWPTLLQKAGMGLMSTIGGASGSLYGTLFIAMSKALREREGAMADWSAAFAQGVEAVKQRGKSDLGEKTMLDALIPAANAWRAAVEERLCLADTLLAIERAAAEGCESTRDMIASKGRASFLGERARGYLDPGARTAQLIMAAITHLIGQEA